jgi:LAS superfamily LD-carboxypeptidase LdcB
LEILAAIFVAALFLFGKSGKQIMRSVGYVNGTAFPIDVEKVDGVWMSFAIARRFERMRDAARAQIGIVLKPNSGFREMHEQERFYAMSPEERAKHGIGQTVAKPGFSNHQSGHAIDIETDYEKAPAKQVILPWLRAHASEFGFVNTVPSEPWHWETLA